MNIEIKNLDKLKKAFNKAPLIAMPILNDAIKKSLIDIQREAVPRTPFDTGQLAGSYRLKYSNLKGTIFPNKVYALYQHEGFFHHRRGERKYLENAVKAKTKTIKQNFEQSIENIFKAIKYLV